LNVDDARLGYGGRRGMEKDAMDNALSGVRCFDWVGI
jgi:hypothetical protein